MRLTLPIALALMMITTSFAENYPIVDAKGPDASVSVDNAVFLTTQGGIVQLGEKFIEGDVNWAPTGPIVCSWNPTLPLVAIFVPHPRVTDVFIAGTQSGKIFKETFPQKDFPDWYDAFSTASTAGEWADNQLAVTTQIKMRDGSTKTLNQTLTVNRDGTFALSPIPEAAP